MTTTTANGFRTNDNGRQSATANENSLGSGGRPLIKRFYIDELGFYRYLDAEEKQYVCSNVNVIERGAYVHSNASSARNNNNNNNKTNGRRMISSNVGGETNLEVCFKSLRHDLGISHFDKTEEYEAWKSSWDEFMRVKLISQQPVTLNRELKTRVRSGIPHDYRCKVWTALIRMRTRNIRSQFGEDIYQIIIRDYVSRVEIPDYLMDNDKDDDENNNNNGQSSSSSQRRSVKRTAAANGTSFIGSMSARPSNTLNDSTNTPITKSQTLLVDSRQFDKCFKQIELDLLRTLPNNRHFENPNSIGIQRVRRVLRAYACFNQAVGYCQGMNRLAAMALLVLPEEEAFWCLVAIIQCIMPKDYYLKPWLAQVDCCVLSDLLEKKMPKLHKHLVRNDIQLTLFTWFFTIFVDGFRPELMLRIWDCFLLEGDKVLFRFALSILYISQEDLLQMNDFSTMSSHLSRLVSTRKLDVEHLFETFNTMNPLSSGQLQTRRDFHRDKMRLLLED